MTRKRKVEHKLTVGKARDVIIQLKEMEGLSRHTIDNYSKLFNDFERCFAKNKYMEDFDIEDSRRIIERQLHLNTHTKFTYLNCINHLIVLQR